MSLFSRFILFIRTDIIWIATGQLIVLITGLLSLKVFTNLLTTEQYAYIALMMAMSAWIWTGVYQPLNQAILRFYSIAEKQGWMGYFLPYILKLEKKLALIILFFSSLLIISVFFINNDYHFLLLLVLSTCMGIVYGGGVHALISYFLAQRQRKKVALLQSGESVFRLMGGVIAFYGLSQTEYALASGVLVGGVILLVLAIVVFRKSLPFKVDDKMIVVDLKKQQTEFNQYFKKTYIVTLFNATVVNLDKWLLFYLIGADGFGKYAAIYMLSIAMASMVYFFFEMVGFPLIFKQEIPSRRRKIVHLLVFSYIFSFSVIILLAHYFGEYFLLLMTTPYIAAGHDIFTLLIFACGMLNLGRLLMVQGLVDKEPHKYWPAYMVLLVVFIGWCLMFVGQGDSYTAAQGFVIGTMAFVFYITYLNKNTH